MPPIQYNIRRKFRKFPLLPPEIRHRIWYFCLPNRIIDFAEVDDMMYDENIEFPDLQQGHYKPKCLHLSDVRDNRRPPIIMRVCREAYIVSLHHGSVDRTGELPTWLQPRLDRVLFYHGMCAGDYPYTESEINRYTAAKVAQLTEVCDWARGLDLPIAFYHLDLYEFHTQQGHRLTDWSPIYIRPHVAFLYKFATRGRCQTFACAVSTIVFHLTREEAACSGLFGHLGEDLCQLVDVDDIECIRRYHALWKPVTADEHEEQRVMRQEWDSLLANEALRTKIDDWQTNLQFTLLAAIWVMEQDRTKQGDKSMDGAFLPQPNGDVPQPKSHKLAETHPWVIATKAWLPTVLPRICFRVCIRARCIVEMEESVRKIRKRKGWWLGKRARATISVPSTHRVRRIKQSKHWGCSSRPYRQNSSKTPPRVLRLKEQIWRAKASQGHKQRLTQAEIDEDMANYMES